MVCFSLSSLTPAIGQREQNRCAKPRQRPRQRSRLAKAFEITLHHGSPSWHCRKDDRAAKDQQINAENDTTKAFDSAFQSLPNFSCTRFAQMLTTNKCVWVKASMTVRHKTTTMADVALGTGRCFRLSDTVTAGMNFEKLSSQQLVDDLARQPSAVEPQTLTRDLGFDGLQPLRYVWVLILRCLQQCTVAAMRFSYVQELKVVLKSCGLGLLTDGVLAVRIGFDSESRRTGEVFRSVRDR